MFPQETLTHALVRDRGQIQVLINAINVLRAQSIEQYLKSIVDRVIRREVNVADASLPFKFEFRILFNPALETAVFMVPGVMCMVVCVLTILLTAMSIAKEKERGTLEMLISAPVNSY